VLVAFGCIQAASNALVMHRGSPSFGLAVYRALDRIAPADYVEDVLGANALERGDADAAQHYAVRMQAGPRRDDLLAQIALARGQTVLAAEYFYVADDVAAIERIADGMTLHDIPGAIDLLQRFRAKLEADGTHPDAVAQLCQETGKWQAALGRDGDAMASYERALALAPLNELYLLSAANQSLVAHRYADARGYYERTLRLNAASADALAGMGVLALRAGRRDDALRYRDRALAIDPKAGMLRELERELR
jgi:tetratricopeptide (TPR) repeat protein